MQPAVDSATRRPTLVPCPGSRPSFSTTDATALVPETVHAQDQHAHLWPFSLPPRALDLTSPDQARVSVATARLGTMGSDVHGLTGHGVFGARPTADRNLGNGDPLDWPETPFVASPECPIPMP